MHNLPFYIVIYSYTSKVRDTVPSQVFKGGLLEMAVMGDVGHSVMAIFDGGIAVDAMYYLGTSNPI